MHWDVKNALKWFSFPSKFDISLLLIKMGGINGVVFPLGEANIIFCCTGSRENFYGSVRQ